MCVVKKSGKKQGWILIEDDIEYVNNDMTFIFIKLF